MTKSKYKGPPPFVTHEQLLNILSYDPITGEFWRDGKLYKVNTPLGYVQIRIFNRLYYGHTLAWFYIYGVWAKVDHRDRNKGNNRINNLREATSSQNLVNSRLRSDNTSGSKGVDWDNRAQKWRARAHKDGKEYHLGYFTSKEFAEKIVRETGEDLHGEFYHDGKLDS